MRFFRCKSCCASFSQSIRILSSSLWVHWHQQCATTARRRSWQHCPTHLLPYPPIRARTQSKIGQNTVLTSSSSCNTDKQIPATRSLMPGGGPPPQNRLRTLCPAAVRLHIQLCNFRRAAVRMSLLIPLVLLPTAISHASTVVSPMRTQLHAQVVWHTQAAARVTV